MLGLTNLDTGKDLSDEEILKRSTAQPWLFSILLDRYQTAFLRKAESIIRDKRDAEEVVQDTFVKIYTNAGKFEPKPGAKFSSWGYRILMNTAFTRYQKLVKEGKRFAVLDPEFEQFIGEKAEHSGFEEKRDGIERVLARLPEHLSYVLRLHYLERWSHEDIAKETKEKVNTVKVRVHRAKAAFRKESREDEAELLL